VWSAALLRKALTRRQSTTDNRNIGLLITNEQRR
jgi:hypothetical protein